jgi:signal peptidase I
MVTLFGRKCRPKFGGRYRSKPVKIGEMTDTAASARPSATRRRTGRIIFWVIFAAAAAGVVAAPLWGSQTVRSFTEPSSSMEPTVQPGNDLLADIGSALLRGDIITLYLPPDFSTKISTGGDYVRRVIGLPGDRVACCDSRGRVTVNGKPLTETYTHPGGQPYSNEPFSVTVGRGQLWVLGDNRGVAVDSRVWGPVPESDVVGRVEILSDGGSFRRVQTPPTFVAEGLAPADDRTPTVAILLILEGLAAPTLLVVTVFGIIRTIIRRRRRRRVRGASAAAEASG